jgi:WD40 repeat protein
MKVAKKRLLEMKMKTKKHSRINNDKTVSFLKHQAIIDVLEKYKQLGEIVSVKSSDSENGAMMKDTSIPPEDQTLNLEVVEDINMKSASDSKECHITGIEVFQPDKIIVCDSSNKTVKCYDKEQKKIVSEMKLNNSPHDVAAITYDRFVVTVPSDKCVHFMSLKNQHIVSHRKVNIRKECRGIAYSNDKLVVSCNEFPGKVLVLDLQGNIMQSFSGDNRMFNFPLYVTVNTAGTSIYVSDSGYSVRVVNQLDWQGNVINTYQPAQGGARLRGICELNDGTFIVCMNQDSDDNLRRVSDNCKSCKITINEKLGRWYPCAVAYCKKTRKLYVSYSETGGIILPCIKVFKVQW